MTKDSNITATVIADSISDGKRLTSMQFKIPTIILAEFNTHRVFSRNASSARAIPVKKIIEEVKTNPFVPSVWTSNKPGMQGDVIIDTMEIMKLTKIWLNARDKALESTEVMMDMGAHKQVANRLLTPFMYNTVLVSSTKWQNFFYLRCAENAEPHIRMLAIDMKKKMEESTPKELKFGEWHLPYITDEEKIWMDLEDQKKVSVARSARVSYVCNEEGKPTVFDKDVGLFNDLKDNKHSSPFEHVATPDDRSLLSGYGNFCCPWIQLRGLLSL